MRRSTPYLLVVLSIFSGCATPPAKDDVSASDVQCQEENISGTLVKKNVCRTQTERDAEQRSNADQQFRQVGGGGH
jgi:hypothetical protein